LQGLSQQIVFSDKEFLDIAKDRALSGLTELLRLPEHPKRIEGYDISHMQGTNVVGSMVVFTNGVSDKGGYRKFKTSQRNDDPANIRETLLRRLSEKNLKEWGVPDLILIDGGTQQVSAAVEAQAERGTRVPIIGVAKREEEIIIKTDGSNIDVSGLASGAEYTVQESSGFVIINLHPGLFKSSGHSLNLRSGFNPQGGEKIHKYDDVIKLIQRIRDESHRFAVSYHSTLRSKQQTASMLDNVPGVGPATRKKLIKTFGSTRGVLQATDAELAEVLGPKKAATLRQHLGAPKQPAA
jgi:excinuclease ABC subunit C